VPTDQPQQLPRRLRRLTTAWPDPSGRISYLLTLCVDQRRAVLATESHFERLVGFLCESPHRYGWFPIRFVMMPDHLHLLVHSGCESTTLGSWVKALKAMVRRPSWNGQTGQPDDRWRWQTGFHDRKLRSDESHAREWEYVVLNPVRAGLVRRPEDWPYCGALLHEASGCRLVRGTPSFPDDRLLIAPEVV
jgi:REP element-mobilizing transposase RayT